MAPREEIPAGPVSAVSPPSGGPGAAVPVVHRSGLTWPLILGLAMSAAVAAWAVGEATRDLFKVSLAVSENYRDSSGLNREMPIVNARKGAMAYGSLGGLLGLALGVAGGAAGRSTRRAVLGGVAGLILGTAAGALPSFVVMPWHWQHRNDDPFTTDLIKPLMVHLGLSSLVGLAAGLAFGIGGRASTAARLLEAAAAGLIGAMIGVFAYEMIGAFAAPGDHTTDPIPETAMMRLLIRVCIAGFVAMGAILVISATPAARGGKPGAGEISTGLEA